MRLLLAALGFLVATTYFPGLSGAATSTRWIVVGCLAPLLLFYPQRIKITAAHLAGALFVAWALLTYLWSSSPDDTIGAGFFLLLMTIAFCLGSLQSDLRQVYIGMAAGLIPSGLCAIAQFHGWDGLVQTASPSGLFVNRNFYAEICAVVAVALIAEKLWWWLPAVAPGLLLTGSRGALLAFVFGAAVIAVRRRQWAVIALGLVAVALLGASIAHKGAATLGFRLDFWEATATHTTLIGNGLGSFSEAVGRLPMLSVEHPHNEFLEFAFETGWIGLALLIAFGATLFRTSFSTETLVLIALLVEAFFEFPFHEPATAFLGLAAAGCLGGRLPWHVGAAWDGGAGIVAWARRHGPRDCWRRLRQVVPSPRPGKGALPV